MDKPKLGDIIEGWPSEVGDSLEELALIPKDTFEAIVASLEPDLAYLVKHLRYQARDLIHSNDGEAPIGTPVAVAASLRDGRLRPKPNWWTAYPLDKRHRRVAARYKSRGSRYAVLLRQKFPTNDELIKDLEAANGYLVVWGGTPDVLAIKGVAERITAFTAAPLVDVVFWEASTLTLHSLRFGLGESPSGRVDFPSAIQTTAHNLKETLWPSNAPKS